MTPAIERWYDGAAWTEHTRALPSARLVAPSPAPSVGRSLTPAPSPTPTPLATTASATSTASATPRASTSTRPDVPSWPITTPWPITTAWPVTPQTRGSELATPVSASALSPAAVATDRSTPSGAHLGGPSASASRDAGTSDAHSEKYPEGWGPSGYEIGPERHRARVRVKAEPASEWSTPPIRTPASGNALTPWPSAGPWPLPSQPLVPTPRPGAKASDPMHWLLPVGRSWQSIVAGYLGLVGLLVWPLAPFAVWLGFWGRSLARAGGNGGGRAVFAIVTGLVGTFVGVLVLMAVVRS